MQTRFLVAATAVALAGATVLASSTSASARWWGWGPAAVAGAVVGGALAATTWPYTYSGTWPNGYYGYGDYAYVPAPSYGYYYGTPSYGAPSFSGGYASVPGAVVGPGAGFEVRDDAYCMRRFRSYDPRSGTYLGYDGIRHSCP